MISNLRSDLTSEAVWRLHCPKKILRNYQKIKSSNSPMSAADLLGPNLVIYVYGGPCLGRSNYLRLRLIGPRHSPLHLRCERVEGGGAAPGPQTGRVSENDLNKPHWISRRAVFNSYHHTELSARQGCLALLNKNVLQCCFAK